MFDSVIRPAQFRQSRWGSGFVVAVAAHAASLALAIYLSKRPAEPPRQEVDVKFVKAPPPPPPPPPPAPQKRSRWRKSRFPGGQTRSFSQRKCRKRSHQRLSRKRKIPAWRAASRAEWSEGWSVESWAAWSAG